MGLIGNELGLRPDEARRTGEKVIAHLIRGNYEAAHVAISRAEFTVQDKPNSTLGNTDWILRVPGGGEGTLHEVKQILHYELMRRKQ